ncbi:MAG: hypothetical protein J0I84_22055 [Terrimonas sp.]|nr:hypothetical protein [Terrimonas sp.]
MDDRIQYRRHSAAHIFQDQYERIQKDTLKIKKVRKGKNLSELNLSLQSLIKEFGSDENVDQYLNKKIQPKLSGIYKILTSQI